MEKIKRTRAQISTNAIERIYITMRHLFIRGFYKPMGVSGNTLINELLILQPEIYGSIGEDITELEGLLYIIDRLPEGIAECRFINLTADEGLRESHFKKIVPAKRRRNCYRIDRDQMTIEITRGRSDIYDILTHLTFMFIEAKKIANKVLINDEGHTIREWKHLEEVVLTNKKINKNEREVLIAHLSTFLGRSYEEIQRTDTNFATAQAPNRFFQVIYWMGKLALNGILEDKKHEITFSPILRERIGHHISGESWAVNIKNELFKRNLFERPIHVISANMHSVMNSIYAPMFLKEEAGNNKGIALFELIGNSENKELRKIIKKGAAKKGLTFIKDTTGANIDVQIIDTEKIDLDKTIYELNHCKDVRPVIIVMDYAFGEQAYETLDELLKPYELRSGEKIHLNIESVSVMGKAGILKGKKGDIMIPNSHIYEGTADNYPFKNELKADDLKDEELNVYEGSMITVLGTSLQNRDLLEFFYNSTWKVIGLEMEGAHYQKAIQSASKIRGNIKKDIKVRYAYYASDNPLETGSTLASGGLGATGVRPTYLITQKILEQIF
ncbi:DUF6909 family protein [Lutimonas vermicola]|uniref:Uncharacterized protein n=1 Tax=Lutimonas vermicola TaxID=414288 RepID=A0ABU9L335_9FLAO